MKRALLLLLLAAPLHASVKDVASATVITLHGSGVYGITGTTTIQTIKGISDGDVVTLVPKGAFGIGNVGNVAAITATATVGRPITLVMANGTVYEAGPSTAASIVTPISIANGGTGQATAAAGFDALAPTTTKGDLIARTSTGNTRVAVTADGDVLTADSASAAGVKFATPSGAGPTQYAEDTVAADAESLSMAGVVRNDTPSSLVSANGDRGELQIDASGRLWVNGSNVTQPISNSNLDAALSTLAKSLQLPAALDGSGFLKVHEQGTATVSGTVTTSPPANASTNVAQIAGTTADTNSGTKSAGTLRVVLATDQPQLTNKLLVTPDSVALPANQSVNVSQINGVTPLMGNGVTGTGSPRVTIASDNTAFTVNAAQSGTWTIQPGNTANTTPWLMDVSKVGGTNTVTGGAAGTLGVGGTQANNAAITANPIIDGIEAISSQPAAATTGNARRVIGTLDGRIYVQQGGPVPWSCGLTAIAATLTQCQAAPAAGLKLYVTDIHVGSNTATGGQFTLRYGTGTNCGTGTTTFYPNIAATTTGVMPYPGNTASLAKINFTTPISAAAANAICVICVATNTCVINMSGFTAP